MFKSLALATVCLSAASAFAAPPDASAINRIADQGLNHGEVVETLAYLTDHIGSRLTISPGMRQAENWIQGRYKSWGLSNIHLEPFDFGRGWWIERSSVWMTSPRRKELRAIPIAWSPGTNGALEAEVVVAPLTAERDFAAWKGKLAGKIVLVTLPRAARDETDAAFHRLDDAEIGRLNVYAIPHYDPDRPDRFAKRIGFDRKLDAFLKSEGALAMVTQAYRDNGRVSGEGYRYHVGDSPALPQVQLGAEDYRRLARLAKTGPVKLSIDSVVHYMDDDHNAHNVIAELPGRDPKAGYVMAGAHLDSWVAGDGATDNGAGSAVVMEAARILAALDVHPKRAIRFALWEGEEQGLLGSYAYINSHLAKLPLAKTPEQAALGPYFTDGYGATPLPGFKDLAAYFNIDNGSGKIRGIHAEGNFAAAPILREWLAPFASMGATSVVAAPTGGTDHVGMIQLGLPAFQFIQDPLDYETQVHHSDLDSFDHARPDDLRQATVILAAMLLNAAERDEPLPRNVTPQQPKPADPFKYKDPSQD